MKALELTGKSAAHVRQFQDPRFVAHPEAAEAFLAMRRAAAVDGIDLHPFSSFRDFDLQVRIWERKYSGQRSLLDRQGRPLDSTMLNERERVFRILDWTALPGASRHHWGTDFDVVDQAMVSTDNPVRLVPEETEPGGPFYRLHCWLNSHMQRFGFFRPYAFDQRGVCPEPWHLSYAPIAVTALKSLSIDMIRCVLIDSDIQGRSLILEMLEEIYHRYVLNITKPLPETG
jgi:LAS superfamily LD-carboxypeptidase LdcB